MPYTAPLPASLSDIMTASEVRTNLNTAGAFVNDGIVVADIPDADSATFPLDERHVYRPETLGFPHNSTVAQTQTIAGRHHANSERAAYRNRNFARMTDRESIPVRFLQGEQRWIVRGMAARVHVTKTSCRLNAMMNIEYTTQYAREFAVLPGPGTIEFVYPKNGGASATDRGARLGNFALLYKKVGDADYTLMPGSQRPIYPGRRWSSPPATFSQQWANNLTMAHSSMGSVQSLTPGMYDVVCAFRKNTSAAGTLAVAQVVVGARNMVVEVLGAT